VCGPFEKHTNKFLRCWDGICAPSRRFPLSNVGDDILGVIVRMQSIGDMINFLFPFVSKLAV